MKTRRTVNYAAPVTRGRTLMLESKLLAELADATHGLTMRELGDILGCGRVDAAYHCKRLRAAGELTLTMEPCDDNAGIKLVAWDNKRYLSRMWAKGAKSDIRELAPSSRRAAS